MPGQQPPGGADRPRLAPGPLAASLLATEHWSLLATRSMVWNEAMSRTAVFLTALSAAIVALALTADATDFGPTFTTFALLLLPALLLLGLATYVRPSFLHFLLTTPTIVMTIDAALLAGATALGLSRLGWSSAAVTTGSAAAFVAAWAGLSASRRGR